MKMSIAMATYNGAKYLQEQLDSFLNQSRQPDELVVYDDGSADDTLGILERFRHRAAFAVHVYRNGWNLGHIKTFEKALSLCTGDIICLSDQDDAWFNNKLEVVERAFIDQSDVMLVINDQIITDENLNPTGFTKLGNTLSAGLSESSFCTGCCSSLRRSLLNIVLPFPDNICGHDTWINRLAVELQIRKVLHFSLQYYRRHGSNTSNSLTSSKDGLSEFDVFRRYGFDDARAGWAGEVEMLRLYIARLRRVIAVDNDVRLAVAAERALLGLQMRVSALRRRTEILSRARWVRLPDLIHFYLDGSYQHFSGWKSLVKDVVR